MTPEAVHSLVSSIIDGLSPRALLGNSVTLRGTVLTAGSWSFDLSRHASVQVIGLGKAAVPQTAALLEMLQGAGPLVRLVPPIAFTKYGHGSGGGVMDVRESGHPVCDERSLASGRALLDAVRPLSEADLLILVLSGGASSIAVSPLAPFTLEDKIQASRELLAAGVPITAMNAIRKEMSAIKNGGLAEAAGCGSILTLVTVDVPDGDIASVGSGPTCFREDAPADLIERARAALDGPLLGKFESHLASDARAEAMRARAAVLKRKRIVTHRLADASTLREVALSALAVRHGRAAAVDPFALSCGVDEGVDEHVRLARELVRAKSAGAAVSGGELGVVVRGRGRGGRNTEFALRAARALFEENLAGLREADLSRLAIVSFGTDGTDGPTDAAGAWIDLAGYREARALGLDPEAILAASDSLEFFRRINRLIRTGPTGTNLMDLRMTLAARG